MSKSVVLNLGSLNNLKPKKQSMEIKRIGRDLAGDDRSPSRASLVSVYDRTVHFAAIPNRLLDPGASMAVQTEQVPNRIEERLQMLGSDKPKILMTHVMISDKRFLAEMNAVWDARVDQNSPLFRACSADDLGSPRPKG